MAKKTFDFSKLIIANSPHMHDRISISKVMLEVIIALVPAITASVYFFRLDAVTVISVSVITCLSAEYLWQKLFKLKVRINDLSAAVTGILFALTLPPSVPWWMVMIGALISILLAKNVFGGLGHNPFNPALVGRAFLQISWPHEMSSWKPVFDAVTTATSVEGVSTATPLAINKFHLHYSLPSYFDFLIGNHAGSIGETSIVALVIGGAFLLYRKHIFAVIPLTYITTVALGAFVFKQGPLFHIFSGGLMLGAIFMATDPVTSPLSGAGRFIFAIGCGVLTILIRLKGGFPECVCFSILIMNMFTPLIDRYTIPKPFGVK
ncbi:MAG: RnfABCDGE type electron transport complex subunit D [Elusimicrobia bacterium]|nr:RnfABCDGE type electron transport complex subunit D [Candidatus Liberimonas magnetica]